MNTGRRSTFGSAFLRSGPVVPTPFFVALLWFAACAAPSDPGGVPRDGAPAVAASTPAAAGRYLVLVGGCNDCHTTGYAETGGNVEESGWLTGSALGYRGPWGTSYPSNLRRTVEGMSEQAWMDLARTRNALPPMPWVSLHAMSDADLAAVYAYLQDLGPAGEAAPVALAPGVEPQGPWMDFTVHGLPASTPTDR